MPRRLLLTGMLLLTCSAAAAKQWKPVAVASLASLECWQGDLGFLAELTQQADLARNVTVALHARSGIESLAGFDPARPWGAVVRTDGLRMTPIVFVPVTNAEQLLKSLSPFLGDAKSVSPGVWKIGRTTLTGYVREQNGWAFLAQSEDALAELPDPLETLGQLPLGYGLAIQIHPANLPEALRTLAIDDLRSRRKPQSGWTENGGLPAALIEPIDGMVDKSFEEFFSDIRQLTLGWKLDRQRKVVLLEAMLEPLDGSRTAQRWSRARPQSTVFKAAAADDADLSLLTSALPRADYAALCAKCAQQLLKRMENATEAQRRSLQAFAEFVGAVLNNSLAAEHPDVAVRILGKSPPYTIVAALRLQDAGSIDRQIRQLARAGGENPLVKIQTDVARLGEARVHSLSPNCDSNELSKLLGEDRAIYLALRGPHLFVASGHRALAALEQTPVQASGQPVDPVQFDARVGTVLAAIARTSTQAELVPVLTLASIGLQGSDDRLVFHAKIAQGRLHSSLECREGILRAAALALNLAALQSQQPTRPARSP